MYIPILNISNTPVEPEDYSDRVPLTIGQSFTTGFKHGYEYYTGGMSVVRLGQLGEALADETSLVHKDVIKDNKHFRDGIDYNLYEDDNGNISEKALDYLAERHDYKKYLDRQSARNPGGFVHSGANIAGAFISQIFDPANIALSMFPLNSVAKVSKWASKGNKILRAGAIGFTEGTVVNTAIEPLLYGRHASENLEFSTGDALLDIFLGGVIGGAFHMGPATLRHFINNPELRVYAQYSSISKMLQGDDANVSQFVKLQNIRERLFDNIRIRKFKKGDDLFSGIDDLAVAYKGNELKELHNLARKYNLFDSDGKVIRDTFTTLHHMRKKIIDDLYDSDIAKLLKKEKVKSTDELSDIGKGIVQDLDERKVVDLQEAELSSRRDAEKAPGLKEFNDSYGVVYDNKGREVLDPDIRKKYIIERSQTTLWETQKNLFDELNRYNPDELVSDEAKVIATIDNRKKLKLSKSQTDSVVKVLRGKKLLRADLENLSTLETNVLDLDGPGGLNGKHNNHKVKDYNERASEIKENIVKSYQDFYLTKEAKQSRVSTAKNDMNTLTKEISDEQIKKSEGNENKLIEDLDEKDMDFAFSENSLDNHTILEKQIYELVEQIGSDNTVLSSKTIKNEILELKYKLGRASQDEETLNSLLKAITDNYYLKKSNDDIFEKTSQEGKVKKTHLLELEEEVINSIKVKEIESGGMLSHTELSDIRTNILASRVEYNFQNIRQKMDALVKRDHFMKIFKEGKYNGDMNKALKAVQDYLQDAGNKSRAFEAEWSYKLKKELREAGVLDLLYKNDPTFNMAVYRDMSRIGLGQKVNTKSASARAAKILNNLSVGMVIRLNKEGASIHILPDHIIKRFHNRDNIKKAGLFNWVNYILPRLDIERTFGNVGDDVKDTVLSNIYNSIVEERLYHKDFNVGVSKGDAFSSYRKHRTLHFKDGEAAFEYDVKFGNGGNLYKSFVETITQRSKRLALAENLGADYYGNLNNILDDLYDMADGTIKSKIKSKKDGFNYFIGLIDGQSHRAENQTLAVWGNTVRTVGNISKLSMAAISALSDIGFMNRALQNQGVGMLRAYSLGIKEMISGRTNADKRYFLEAFGICADVYRSEVMRFIDVDGMKGKNLRLTEKFFKWSGLDLITRAGKSAFILVDSWHIGNMVNKSWDQIDVNLKGIFSEYGISKLDWDIARVSKLSKWEDGKAFFDVRNIDDIDVANKFRKYFIEEANLASPTPNETTTALMRQRQKRGTFTGEVLQTLTQFKSFPFTIGHRVIGREWAKEGAARYTGMVSLMLHTTMWGYAAMSVKDLLRNKTIRNPFDEDGINTDTLLAAFLQGGGTSIAGDFLYGALEDRYGNSAFETLLGPTWPEVKTVGHVMGYALRADPKVAKELGKLFNRNLGVLAYVHPALLAVNLPYTKTAYEYIAGYQIEEWLNPGAIRRKKQHMKERGQDYLFINPSDVWN